MEENVQKANYDITINFFAICFFLLLLINYIINQHKQLSFFLQTTENILHKTKEVNKPLVINA